MPQDLPPPPPPPICPTCGQRHETNKPCQDTLPPGDGQP